MAARKLQQEIDKTFKKIAEGRQAFDGLYEKIQVTTNAAQKEKLEDNLKREIKKLQRHRDQIKTWCAGNEIKDKKPLLEQRKLIENEMERFKAVEKEMKTKAFSKEGLSAAAKLDPKEQEKADGAQFLAEMVEEVDRQLETLEAEQESLEATTKKSKKDTSKADRLSSIARLQETHRWHQGKLELLLRALQNGNVAIEQLNEIKEGIKYYVEENQSMEYVDDDTLYDEFDLEADEGWGAGGEGDKGSSQDGQSNHEDSNDAVPPPPAPSKRGSGQEPSAASARRPSNQLKSPLPALATLHTAATSSAVGGSSGNMKPAPPPTRAPGETLKYASAAAAGAASEKTSITPLPPAPGVAHAIQPHVSRNNSMASPGSAHAVPVSAHAALAQKASASAADSAFTGSTAGRSPTVSTAATSSMPPTPALEKSETASSARGKAAQTLPATEEAAEASPTSDEPRTPSREDDSSEPAVQSEDQLGLQLPPGLEDLFRSFELTKDRVQAEPSPADLRMLEASHRGCPDPREADKPQHYPSQHKYTTPSFYPQEPSQLADDPSFYSRIDTDTLFFIFYYRQGTYQQYLAAKSLKNQSWRFHKQYQTWFQRHEEPKTITEEFEQGTYRFFDYESTWMNRRKADFKFVYKFLEDDF